MRSQQKFAKKLLVLFMLLAVLGIGFWQVSGKRSAVEAHSSTAKAKTTARSGNLISVAILIAPGAKNKSINLGSKDDLAVAILSSAGFDAKTINPASLRFAGAPIMKAKGSQPHNRGTSDVKASAVGKQFNIAFEDVDGDKRADLIAHFSIPYLSALSAGAREAVLTGKTFAGAGISGSALAQATGASILRSNAPNGLPGFCNTNLITINDESGGDAPSIINAPATPYPSTIDVSGLTGVINSLTVSVFDVSHTFVQDVSVLLVSPSGQKMILWSQASDGSPSTDANLTFDDTATEYLPINAAIVSGAFKPTNRAGNNTFGDVDFPAPAPTSTPTSPYAATLATFQGIDPNGTWSLYVVDNATGDSGLISGGWCLNINTSSSVVTCKPTLFQGAIEAGDATQVDRLLRDAIPSECVGTAKTCPGASGGSTTLRYDTYSLTNQSFSPACVTVTTTSACGTNVFATAYLTSYTPPPPGANLCINYLADAGVSPNATNGIGNAFSFTVPAGATFVLVVNEVDATGCTDYSLLVEGEICAPDAGVCQIGCPANITQANDADQCGAVVTYPAPTTTAACGAATCSPASGSFFAVGSTNVTCTAPSSQTGRPHGGGGDVATCVFTITINDTQAPSITCPANITVSNDANQCGAVVNFSPTVTDNCPNPTASCSPASGSFFAAGTTTVTCTASDNSPSSPDATCTFTVTVNDTQAPSITCPTNIVVVAAPACPAPVGSVVTYATPTATDNCPGVTVACVPASGTVFPTGTTTVTCTATDASNNTATCSFSVKVFDVCVQDRSNPAAVLAWNTATGDYVFCCNGTTFTGVGKVKRTGCTYTLEHTAADRRVTGKVDFSTFRGEGVVQSPVGTPRCTISDNDIRNNDCSCVGGGTPLFRAK